MFFFLSRVIKFDKKCLNSTQRSKIHFPRRGYLSPGNFIVLEVEAALLFIWVTNSCWFWGSSVEILITDLFIFVIHARTAGLFATTNLQSLTHSLTHSLLQPDDIVCSALIKCTTTRKKKNERTSIYKYLQVRQRFTSFWIATQLSLSKKTKGLLKYQLPQRKTIVCLYTSLYSFLSS